MRESKMLEQVRRWRAEAYQAARRQTQAVRLQRTRDCAARLDLPFINTDPEAPSDASPPTAPEPRDR